MILDGVSDRVRHVAMMEMIHDIVVLIPVAGSQYGFKESKKDVNEVNFKKNIHALEDKYDGAGKDFREQCHLLCCRFKNYKYMNYIQCIDLCQGIRINHV